ncbi:MAG: cytochrome P460 family protein [Pseudomonadota bacterium]
MRFLKQRLSSPILVFGFVAMVTALGATAQSVEEEEHLAIPDPADLSKADALRIYEELLPVLTEGYERARLDFFEGYETWQLYNTAPYVSATHGQRYVNNYANRIARDYGTLAPGEKLPVGSVLAKDSITVMEDGRAFPAAMFLMEKLAEGTSPETADWRYVMVIPDGSLFGDTTGDQPERVVYCHVCHEQVADRDYTFYVPEDYRVTE